MIKNGQILSKKDWKRSKLYQNCDHRLEFVVGIKILSESSSEFEIQIRIDDNKSISILNFKSSFQPEGNATTKEDDKVEQQLTSNIKMLFAIDMV